jgi:hypothetical protein
MRPKAHILPPISVIFNLRTPTLGFFGMDGRFSQIASKQPIMRDPLN